MNNKRKMEKKKRGGIDGREVTFHYNLIAWA
jgi:hypothetical protein